MDDCPIHRCVESSRWLGWSECDRDSFDQIRKRERCDCNLHEHCFEKRDCDPDQGLTIQELPELRSELRPELGPQMLSENSDMVTDEDNCLPEATVNPEVIVTEHMTNEMVLAPLHTEEPMTEGRPETPTQEPATVEVPETREVFEAELESEAVTEVVTKALTEATPEAETETVTDPITVATVIDKCFMDSNCGACQQDCTVNSPNATDTDSCGCNCYPGFRLHCDGATCIPEDDVEPPIYRENSVGHESCPDESWFKVGSRCYKGSESQMTVAEGKIYRLLEKLKKKLKKYHCFHKFNFS